MNNILAIILWFLLWYFVALRGMMYLIIDYMLNKSNRKKRRKGQNFFEWFFYTRYKDVVPMAYKVYFYFGIVSWVVACIFIFILALTTNDDFFVDLILVTYIIANISWGGWIFLRWYNWKKRTFEPGRTLPSPKRDRS